MTLFNVNVGNWHVSSILTEGTPESKSLQVPTEMTSLMKTPDDYTDPRKYVVARHDFRRVPRWPNDGIERERQQLLDGTTEHYEFETTDPDQLALTELFGGWIMGAPLASSDPVTRGFCLSLPWMMQHKAAEEQQQGELSQQAAADYLLDAYRSKDETVRRLVDRIGCRMALHKASRDPSRFPDFRAILMPLLQQNLGSDQNIELLFGRVERVLPLLFEIGAHIAEPPPSGSPEAAFMAQYHAPRAAAAPKLCADCGTAEGNLKRCTACKTVHYCSKGSVHSFALFLSPFILSEHSTYFSLLFARSVSNTSLGCAQARLPLGSG